MLAQKFARAGLANSWRGLSSSLTEIRRMIMVDFGIGALPLHVAQEDERAGRIRQVPPYDALPMVNIYLITNPARRQSNAEAAFLSMLTDELARTGLDERTYGA